MTSRENALGSARKSRSRREMIQWLAMLGAVPRLSRAEPQSDQPPIYGDEEAYQVYSSLIPSDRIWAAAQAESLVIAALTMSPEMCLEPQGESADVLGPAIANYKELAKKRWLLKRQFSLSKPYTLVEQDEIDDYFREGGGGWDRFYAHYPKSGGFLFFSPVGFNSAKDVAVLQVSHSCGRLCGGGGFSVLHKRDGEWKRMDWKGSSCAWAS